MADEQFPIDVGLFNDLNKNALVDALNSVCPSLIQIALHFNTLLIGQRSKNTCT